MTVSLNTTTTIVDGYGKGLFQMNAKEIFVHINKYIPDWKIGSLVCLTITMGYYNASSVQIGLLEKCLSFSNLRSWGLGWFSENIGEVKTIYSHVDLQIRYPKRFTRGSIYNRIHVLLKGFGRVVTLRSRRRF